MPELRYDPTTGRQIIIAPERMARPNAMALKAWSYDDEPTCPFCAGREDQTPHELSRYSDAGSDWHVRVVPNKFPAVSMESAELPESSELFINDVVLGQQEVIIESPRHIQSFTQLDAASACTVVQAYRDRQAAASANSKHQAGIVFKNFGPAAGASLGHIHSQFVAFAATPTVLAKEVICASNYFRSYDTCLFCAIATTETELEKRVVRADEHFVAYCPFASRQPYEITIVPRAHQCRFERLSDDQCALLAEFLLGVLHQLEAALPHVCYNFWVHSAPFDIADERHYHWHLEILPRATTTAGFEWGSGELINSVPPEQAAHQLRACRGD